MFEKFTDIPVVIQPFYIEVIKSEPKLDDEGNQVYEAVEEESIDRDGNPITITVQEPVFHDVVYVELKAKSETKTMMDVERVMKAHRGKRDDVIKTFLAMVNVSIEWDFHDNYIAWMEAIDTTTSKIEAMVIDENSEFYEDDLQKLEQLQENLKALKELEPKVPALTDPDSWFLEHYKELRSAALPTKEEQVEMQVEDMMNGTDTFHELILDIYKHYPAPTES